MQILPLFLFGSQKSVRLLYHAIQTVLKGFSRPRFSAFTKLT